MRIWEAMAISVGSGSYTKWDSYTQSTQIHQPHPHAHLSMFSYLLHRFIIKIRCRWSQKAFATKWLPSGHHHFQYQCWPEQEQEEAKWSRSNSTENPAEHFIGDEIKYTIINLCPCVFFSRLERDLNDTKTVYISEYYLACRFVIMRLRWRPKFRLTSLNINCLLRFHNGR